MNKNNIQWAKELPTQELAAIIELIHRERPNDVHAAALHAAAERLRQLDALNSD